MNSVWSQNYDPLGNVYLSTIAAAIPAVCLFYLLAIRRIAAWKAAVYAFAVAIVVALTAFGMPAQMVAGAVAHGLVYGLFRIAWVVIAAVFVYELTVESGQFETLKQSIAAITGDLRLQVLLIAFAFGALLEGAEGGGGAPVAVTAAMMIGVGFPPFPTAVLCLIANSAPVAFGGLGNPIRTLAAVTGLPEPDFSAMVGRILPLTTLVLPFWLVRMMASTKDTLAVWPGLLVCGISFGCFQFFWSNFMDASLVDIVGGIGTLLILAVFFGKVWKPAAVWEFPGWTAPVKPKGQPQLTAGRVFLAWSPFLLLSVFVVIWGLPAVARVLDSYSIKFPVPGLHLQVLRQVPAVPKPYAEPAIFDFAWLSTVGTGTFFAGLLAGPLLGLSMAQTMRVFFGVLFRLRFSVAAIMAMLSLGYLTRYSGMDATLGLALAHTGVLFPLFGTLIGWLGVALSGTDAGSNALFGSLQVITANKLGLSPILMGAANSAGGVMGKMMAAQSLVIACAATGQEGKEGLLLRAVAVHSVILALLVGAIVLMYAYVFPDAIPSGHHYW